jgi:hypothetical protein
VSRGKPNALQEIELDIEDLQQHMVVLDSKESSDSTKIELLSAIVTKQHKMIVSMKDSLLNITKNMLQNEFVVLNLKEIPNEDRDSLCQSVIHLLNTMGFTAEIDFELLYRRGAPRDSSDDAPRPAIVRLHRRDLVEQILRNAFKNRPGKNQPRIVPHLPEPLRQQRAKFGTIGSKKYTADKNAKIKVKDDHVLVNNVKIKDNVHAATPDDILFMDVQTRATLQYIVFTTTNPISCKGSTFQIFLYDVHNEEQCRQAHKAIASIPQIASATHLISAYTLQSGEIGWQDDGDHGLGKFLLKTMEQRGLTNTICFMTREYGGTHIGRRRFEILQQLVDDVIINKQAPADQHGNVPFRTTPPAMTLPHPSETQDWEQPRRTIQAARRNEYHSDDTGFKAATHGSQTSVDNNMDLSFSANPNTENATKDLLPLNTAATKDENKTDMPKVATATITEDTNNKAVAIVTDTIANTD